MGEYRFSVSPRRRTSLRQAAMRLRLCGSANSIRPAGVQDMSIRKTPTLLKSLDEKTNNKYD